MARQLRSGSPDAHRTKPVLDKRTDASVSGRRKALDHACPPTSVTRTPTCSRRLAHDRQTQHTQKYHHHLAAVKVARAEPGRKHLAIPSGKLALKLRLQRLYRYRRCCMRCMEQSHSAPRTHHINRNEKLGSCRSLISDFGINALKQLPHPPPKDTRQLNLELFTC